MSLIQELYEPHVLPARARIPTDEVMHRLTAPDLESHVVERFFIQYHALGVYMAEPLEGWLRRAGQRCLQQGLDTLGKGLLAHARQESHQREQLVEDTRLLVRRWNLRRPRPLRSERLLTQYPTDTMRAWRAAVEGALGHELPGAGLVPLYEWTQLTQTVGPHLMALVSRVLGREALEGLGYLREHSQVDTARAHTQARLMEELVRTMPENTPALAELGTEALGLGLHFLEDCLQSAEAALGSPPPDTAAA
jgi:hypothetical protein